MAVYVVRLHGFAIVEANSADQARDYILAHADCFVSPTVTEASDQDCVSVLVFIAE